MNTNNYHVKPFTDELKEKITSNVFRAFDKAEDVIRKYIDDVESLSEKDLSIINLLVYIRYVSRMILGDSSACGYFIDDDITIKYLLNGMDPIENIDENSSPIVYEKHSSEEIIEGVKDSIQKINESYSLNALDNVKNFEMIPAGELAELRIALKILELKKFCFENL